MNGTAASLQDFIRGEDTAQRVKDQVLENHGRYNFVRGEDMAQRVKDQGLENQGRYNTSGLRPVKRRNGKRTDVTGIRATGTTEKRGRSLQFIFRHIF